MIPKNVLSELEHIVGKENVLTDYADIFVYSYDATQLHKVPDVVVIVSNSNQVSRVIKIARENNINIYPRGSGTSISGGPIPAEGGIVLELGRMNKILDIDTENMIAIVEPGVVAAVLDAEVAKKGLFYPPDPGSLSVATIGGCVAEGAGGLRGLKYGTTKNYVIGLEVVLPSSEIIQTGGLSLRGSPGFDLTHLFVCSEGTLGIITKIMLKLIYPPKKIKTMLVMFDEIESAGLAVARIVENKVIPSTLELLDKVSINAIEDFNRVGLPRDIEALLLIEVDGEPEDVEKSAKIVEDVCSTTGARSIEVAKDENERKRLTQARRSLFPVLARLKPTAITEDATVPRSKVPLMVKRIHEIKEKYNLLVGSCGHVGDGNMHPIFLTDKRDKAEMEKVEKAVSEIFDYCIELGGTLTGEHGIGVVKAKFMEREFKKEGIKFFSDIKRAIDPQNIMNPNKIIMTKEIKVDYV
ncbi:D-lactate dehydrogenase (cytochrome) [Thermodesulfobium narugense DSM 14796]|uniref:D-lactate dehydrogenase (Cytochrome) n=1 Tax=Thermodesulfobium narugense DSM 14796 TaxID=747365 RepID=M1E4S6_9BACT|nr:FAD-linked oxidase C-terminal domain-containing protein [Thermodesulfobium narugense]AEE14487.1 D-lactate dehydrogenase (cytochrome) [Thermodesulfobium narugense DSM 14796]